MTLQQLRYLIAIADSGLNITLAAERVYATQPGISKQLKQLEDELGLRIFTRKGKSLDSITPAGQTIIERARVILREAANIKALAADSRADAKGAITIATTHTQARFVLPETLARFRQRYPDVSLHIAQESDADIVAKVKSGAVEFGFNSSTGAASEGLISLPAYRWQRVVLVPKDHPLSQLKRPLQIADLAKYPLVSYDSSVNADSSLNQAFRDQGLTPKFAITARDADVIKTYVRAGMGVGILAEMAVSRDDLNELVALPVPSAIPACVTWVLLRHNTLLRRYGRQLLEWLTPHINQQELEAIIAGQASVYPLIDRTPRWSNGSIDIIKAA